MLYTNLIFVYIFILYLNFCRLSNSGNITSCLTVQNKSHDNKIAKELVVLVLFKKKYTRQ